MKEFLNWAAIAFLLLALLNLIFSWVVTFMHGTPYLELLKVVAYLLGAIAIRQFKMDNYPNT